MSFQTVSEGWDNSSHALIVLSGQAAVNFPIQQTFS